MAIWIGTSQVEVVVETMRIEKEFQTETRCFVGHVSNSKSARSFIKKCSLIIDSDYGCLPEVNKFCAHEQEILQGKGSQINQSGKQEYTCPVFDRQLLEESPTPVRLVRSRFLQSNQCLS
jgi:hypothetical protein